MSKKPRKKRFFSEKDKKRIAALAQEYLKNETPEQKERRIKKISNTCKKKFLNQSAATKKRENRNKSIASRKRWAKATPEQRKECGEWIRKASAKRKEGKTKLEIKQMNAIVYTRREALDYIAYKRSLFLQRVPRKVNYCGVTTMKEMNEL